jgi:hypothetical protein
MPDGFATWGSTKAFEVPGSRTETYGLREMTAKVQLICDWADRYAIMQDICRTKYPLPPGATDYYWDSYPKSMSVSVWEEAGQEGDVYEVTYTKAKVDVDYICKSKVPDSSVTETHTPILNMRRIPSWGFYWGSDGSPVSDEESPTVVNVQLKIQRQLTGCPFVPSWFMDLAGCINQNVWVDDITGVVHDRGTLLFMPSSASKQLTTNPEDVDNVWDISFEMMWNPIGWNRFQRPFAQSTTGIDSIMWKGQPFNLYQEKPFIFS